MDIIKLFENFDSEMKLKENIKRLSSFSYPNGKVKISLRLMSDFDNPLEATADTEDEALTELADLVTFKGFEKEINSFIDGMDSSTED
jgi:hypothetical protein